MFDFAIKMMIQKKRCKYTHFFPITSKYRTVFNIE